MQKHVVKLTFCSLTNAVFCAQGSGRFRERLVYVFRTFSKKSCNSTVLQRSDLQKHVVKLTFFRKCVKTRRTIDDIFANVSKHVVKSTSFFINMQKHVVKLTFFSLINAVFCPQGSGRFRARLVYVFHTFPKQSCNSTVLQRSDHQKHVVKLTFVLYICQNTS